MSFIAINCAQCACLYVDSTYVDGDIPRIYPPLSGKHGNSTLQYSKQFRKVGIGFYDLTKVQQERERVLRIVFKS